MIDPREVNEMARLKAILEGCPMPEASEASDDPVAAPAIPSGEADLSAKPEVAAMKAILERFTAATDGTAMALASRASYDRELREALVTEETEQGARIGPWEIRVRGEGNRKLYDVGRVGESERIAADLTLYEAAHGLARILNEGGQVNSKAALDLLAAEQDYASALGDAIHFKRLMTRNPDSPRFPIYEDRYGAAQRKAIAARNRVFKLAGSRSY